MQEVFATLDNALPGGGDERICIAVLDGPVDLSHPCFLGATIESPLGNHDSDPHSAATAHGTHVASIIFGQPDTVVEGIAPRCRGMSIPIFRAAGDAPLACSQLELARAILTALGHGAHIVNISGGEVSDPEEANFFLRDALAQCEAAGVLVVAAAGNDGCACVHMPAGAATVLAVGAADIHGAPLPFSNWGPVYQANGILAPGQDIEGAAPGAATVRRTGTSFAAPIVSGLAACMLADQLARGEEPSPLTVRQALIGSAIPCDPRDDERCLTGRVNPVGAIQHLNGGRRTMSHATAVQLHGGDGVRPSHQAGETGSDFATEARSRPVDPNAGGLMPSDCGCGCGGEKKDCGCGCGGTKAAPQRIFALGQIGYDFGSEARRDSIRQFLPPKAEITPATLLAALAPGGDVQPEVERITWLLKIDQTPLYALQPSGAFAFNGYAQILAAFEAQNRPPVVVGGPTGGAPDEPADHAETGKKKKAPDESETIEGIVKQPVDLFAVAGVTSGSIRLMSGETVPILIPSARGIIGWDIKQSYDAFLARLTADPGDGKVEKMFRDDPGIFYHIFSGLLGDFKNLITRKYRNLGVLGRERALNFAAMSAFTVFDYLKEMIGLDLIIDDISVSASPACRQGSECYDVQIRTFRQSDVTASLRVFQFTLDVSDTIPVDIGNVAAWSERPKR